MFIDEWRTKVIMMKAKAEAKGNANTKAKDER